MKLVFTGVDEIPAPSGTRVVHLSDLHIGKGRDPDEKRVFHRILEVVEDLEVDVIVVSGDLVHFPDDVVSLEWVRECLEETGRPWVVIPGNHDIESPDHPEEFAHSYGDYPRFERHAGLGFALFDSFCGLPLEERDDDELESLEIEGYLSHGDVPGSQYEVLAPQIEEPWIAVVHHHVRPEPEDADTPSMRPLRNYESFISWCSSFGASAVLHGHKHDYARVRIDRDLPVFRGGATAKLPTVFRVIDFDDGLEWYEISVEAE